MDSDGGGSFIAKGDYPGGENGMEQHVGDPSTHGETCGRPIPPKPIIASLFIFSQKVRYTTNGNAHQDDHKAILIR
ncbi:hypothetical protein CEXT_84681 [Caerostris extrusa]|uniref:Uncharacterized protein n=1 Tax=Caerostris extrusa TaxID=172846 RepID=A0AAV4RP78_CAEEX|nr:hypothetical protein CEXT_84681 [Caerostris extrusa]